MKPTKEVYHFFQAALEALAHPLCSGTWTAPWLTMWPLWRMVTHFALGEGKVIIVLGHSRDWSAVWWFMAGMLELWAIALASYDIPKGCLNTRNKNVWIKFYPTLDQAHTGFLLQILQPQDLRILLMQVTCRNIGRAKDLWILFSFPPAPQNRYSGRIGGWGVLLIDN